MLFGCGVHEVTPVSLFVPGRYMLCCLWIIHQPKGRTTTMLRSFFAKEDGQELVEYALILVLIAIVVIGILTLLGGRVSEVFSSINSGLQ